MINAPGEGEEKIVWMILNAPMAIAQIKCGLGEMVCFQRAAAWEQSKQLHQETGYLTSDVDIPEHEQSYKIKPNQQDSNQFNKAKKAKHNQQPCLLVGVTEIGPALALETEARSHRAPETREVTKTTTNTTMA